MQFINPQTLADIRKRLMRHQTTKVASASGVHRNTVRAIRNGVNLNPTIGTLHALSQTLDSMEGVEHE